VKEKGGGSDRKGRDKQKKGGGRNIYLSWDSVSHKAFEWGGTSSCPGKMDNTSRSCITPGGYQGKCCNKMTNGKDKHL